MAVNNLAFSPFQGESGTQNFLSAYAQSQQIAQQRDAAERNKVLAGRQDEQYEREKKMQAIDALGGALDGVQDGDAQGFERVKSWAVQNGILDANEAQKYTVQNLPQIRAMSQQARAMIKERQAADMEAKKFDLDRRSTEANIRQSDAAAAASRANAAYIAGGKAQPNGKNLTGPMEKEFGSMGDQLSQVTSSTASFKDEYAGRGFLGMGGETRNLVDRVGGGSEAANWWQEYDRYKTVVRNQLFGASLTPGEQAAFEAADITPNMGAATIRTNLATQQRIIQNALTRRANAARAQGYNGQAIEYLTGLGGQDASQAQQQETPQAPSFTRGQGVFTDRPVQQAPAANGWSIKRVQ